MTSRHGSVKLSISSIKSKPPLPSISKTELSRTWEIQESSSNGFSGADPSKVVQFMSQIFKHCWTPIVFPHPTGPYHNRGLCFSFPVIWAIKSVHDFAFPRFCKVNEIFGGVFLLDFCRTFSRETLFFVGFIFVIGMTEGTVSILTLVLGDSCVSFFTAGASSKARTISVGLPSTPYKVRWWTSCWNRIRNVLCRQSF